MGAPQARYGASGGIQNGKALNGSGRGEFRLAGEGGPLFVGFQLNGSSVLAESARAMSLSSRTFGSGRSR